MQEELASYLSELDKICPQVVDISNIQERFTNVRYVYPFIEKVFDIKVDKENTLDTSSYPLGVRKDALLKLFMLIPSAQERDFATDLAEGLCMYDQNALLDFADMLCAVYRDKEECRPQEFVKS